MKLLLIGCLLIILAISAGCGGTKEAMQAYQNVEMARAASWSNAQKALAENPTTFKCELAPNAGEKEVRFTGTFKCAATVQSGGAISAMPKPTRRPPTDAEIAGDVAKHGLGYLSNMFFGWVIRDIAVEAVRQPKIQAGGDFAGRDHFVTTTKTKTITKTNSNVPLEPEE